MTTTRAGLRAAGALSQRLGGADRVDPAPDEVGTRRTVVIERVAPELDGGRYPVKRVVGDVLLVTADILADGHELLDAALLVRAEDDPAETWHEAPMRLVDNDRWAGRVTLERNVRHRYTIEAWRDAWGSWVEGIGKKVDAGIAVPTELAEGRVLLTAALDRARAAGDAAATRGIEAALAALDRGSTEAATVTALTAEPLLAQMRRHADRGAATRYPLELEVVVDRERARHGAWYELFPRSQGRDPAAPTATTLAYAIWRLDDIAAMGFDVVYLPPIHPIGVTHRKGRNNTLVAEPGDPGSPYAIGAAEGGHREVAPELGGLEAFERFRRAVEERGMELALDIAIQASPDHPYVTSHPEWFRHAPDGTIKYAENPPKKYQDIYPIDFYGDDPDARRALWEEWRDVFRLWVERGVRIFRVDNPHTKPLPFWAWLIREVQREHPDVVFLSEAFTRPKMMRALGKIGFTQSYTYFTWRETAAELRDYLTELTQSEMAEYYRGNLFANTPDINPHHLDHGRPAFVIRSVLAATLSPSYGIYSGWELCEAARLGDREEYLDSEKYEIRARDWDAPGNIKLLIGELNRLRHAHPALQLYDNLRFESVTGDRTLFYRKALPDPATPADPLTGQPSRWSDAIFVAVNCDPTSAQTAILHPDLPAIGIGWDDPYRVTNLLSGEERTERGADLAVDLNPAGEPFRIFRITPL
ncbi:MAG TPA: alpha-1,4-glucan--maltose-1-phosphate maltosyltransferase [Candidatus Limnocylindria bacterium]|nr:alpha-1,4-glucan--maltose-1-phosphate maltosyltransferase [Candidatus Limnocylindria bacterium]